MPDRISVGPLAENAYLIPVGEGECIVVDPGAEAEAIAERMDKRGWRPRLIALTHGHLDHTAAIPTLQAICAGRGLSLPVAVHEADAAYFGARAEATNKRVFADIFALQYFERYFVPLPEPDILLRDGDYLPGTRIRVLHTPGHTAGSACFFIEESGELFSGDTLFEAGVGRTDGFDSSQDLLDASLRKVLFALPDSTLVYPGHGNATSISAEKLFA